MEDETIELHLKTINDGLTRIEQATQSGLQQMAETTQFGFTEVRASQTATDLKIVQIETTVGGLETTIGGLKAQVEKIKSNPILSLGAGTLGGGGIIGALVYYFGQTGIPPS